MKHLVLALTSTLALACAASSDVADSGPTAGRASSAGQSGTGSGGSTSGQGGTGGRSGSITGAGASTGRPPIPDGGCDPYAADSPCVDGGRVCAPGTLACAELPGCTASDENTTTDPCLPFGESCQFTASGGCGPQKAMSLCDSAIPYPCGFAAPFRCQASPVYAGVEQCVVPCVTQDDCFDATTVCATGPDGQRGCQLNYCAERNGQSLPGSYFGSCPVADAGVGTCIPYGATGNTFGVCYASGGVAAGGLCRFDAGAAGRCPSGEYCLDLPPAYCAPFAGNGPGSYADGGPGCETGAIAFNLQAVLFLDIDAAICLPACSPDDAGFSHSCAAGVQCLPVSCSDPRTACF